MEWSGVERRGEERKVKVGREKRRSKVEVKERKGEKGGRMEK